MARDKLGHEIMRLAWLRQSINRLELDTSFGKAKFILKSPKGGIGLEGNSIMSLVDQALKMESNQPIPKDKSRKVLIALRKGIVSLSSKPKDIKVILYDYDVEGTGKNCERTELTKE